MSPERLAEIRARADSAAPGPWEPCQAVDGNCHCGLIWSIPADAVVCTVSKSGEEEYGEGFLHKAALAHAKFIAHAREDIPELLDWIDHLAAQRAEPRAP